MFFNFTFCICLVEDTEEQIGSNISSESDISDSDDTQEQENDELIDDKTGLEFLISNKTLEEVITINNDNTAYFKYFADTTGINKCSCSRSATSTNRNHSLHH